MSIPWSDGETLQTHLRDYVEDQLDLRRHSVRELLASFKRLRDANDEYSVYAVRELANRKAKVRACKQWLAENAD